MSKTMATEAAAAREPGTWCPPPDEFRRMMERERARSERTGEPFSLIALDLSGLAEDEALHVIRVARDRRRLTDDLGWMERGRLGILLPETGPEGAQRYAGDLVRLLGESGGPLGIRLYHFACREPSGDGPRKPPGDRDSDRGGPASGPPADGTGGTPAGGTDGHLPVEDIGPLFRVPTPAWKRVHDVLVSSVFLVAFAPLALAAALGLKLSAPREAVVEAHWRAGRGGIPFRLYRLRTRPRGSDRETLLGSVLTRTAIADIPVLWNVLRGDLSVVGPKPPTLDEARRYEPWQRRRLDCVGGLAHPAQLAEVARAPCVPWSRREIAEVPRYSPVADLKLLVRTVGSVLSGRSTT